MTQPEPLILALDELPARLTGQWVHEKNYYVCRYLDIMTHGVVKKWDAKLAYVDLFAGPGRSIIRGTQEEVEGSPVLSLRYEFAKYVFVDKPQVLSSLKKRLSAHPKFSQIVFVEGDCNDVIDDVRSALPADHLNARIHRSHKAADSIPHGSAVGSKPEDRPADDTSVWHGH